MKQFKCNSCDSQFDETISIYKKADFKAGYIAALRDPLVVEMLEAAISVTTAGRSTLEDDIGDLCEAIDNFNQALKELGK